MQYRLLKDLYMVSLSRIPPFSYLTEEQVAQGVSRTHSAGDLYNWDADTGTLQSVTDEGIVPHVYHTLDKALPDPDYWELVTQTQSCGPISMKTENPEKKRGSRTFVEILEDVIDIASLGLRVTNDIQRINMKESKNLLIEAGEKRADKIRKSRKKK